MTDQSLPSFQNRSAKAAQDNSRPRPTIPVWLTPEEASQIIAISEKQGILASVASKIQTSKETQQTR